MNAWEWAASVAGVFFVVIFLLLVWALSRMAAYLEDE